jgi:hypothetical protein
MKRLWMFALLSMAACATNPGRGTIADMRHFKMGLCASGSSGVLIGYANLMSCAQVGAPDTLADDGKTPVITTMLDSDGWELANPGNWQLEVFHDGKLAFKKMLTRSVPSVGICTSDGCTKHGFDTQVFEYGWQPGVYRFRYTCAFDTSRVVETAVTVMPGDQPVTTKKAVPTAPVKQDSAPPQVASAASAPVLIPALFKPERPPKKAWGDGFDQKYTAQCIKMLQAKYGAQRTPAQVQYACECITWNFQDRWSFGEMYDLAKSDPKQVQDATVQVSAECKKNRPPELGPDPQ